MNFFLPQSQERNFDSGPEFWHPREFGIRILIRNPGYNFIRDYSSCPLIFSDMPHTFFLKTKMFIDHVLCQNLDLNCNFTDQLVRGTFKMILYSKKGIKDLM